MKVPFPSCICHIRVSIPNVSTTKGCYWLASLAVANSEGLLPFGSKFWMPNYSLASLKRQQFGQRGKAYWLKAGDYIYMIGPVIPNSWKLYHRPLTEHCFLVKSWKSLELGPLLVFYFIRFVYSICSVTPNSF
jgi:hypothetical protein